MKVFLILGMIATCSSLWAEDYKFNVDSTSARYEVPVSDELKEYASFKLSDLEKKIRGDKLVVEYSIPNVLTGNSEFIHLEGKIHLFKDEVVMVGDKAAARCKGIFIKTTCSIQYNGLEIDEDRAILAIKKISTSDKEINGRIEVMRAFSTDPVGKITY